MQRATGRMQRCLTSCRKPSACDSDAAAPPAAALVVAEVVAVAEGVAASRAEPVEVVCDHPSTGWIASC